MATSQASPGSPDISRILQFLILRPGGFPVNVTNGSQLATSAIAVYIRMSFVRSIGNPEIQNHPWNITCEINLETTNSDWKKQIWIYLGLPLDKNFCLFRRIGLLGVWCFKTVLGRVSIFAMNLRFKGSKYIGMLGFGILGFRFEGATLPLLCMQCLQG